jgi:hypothetical protein
VACPTQVIAADTIAREVTIGRIAFPLRLLDRLLAYVGTAGPLPGGGVEVGGEQDDAALAALRHHLGDGPPLIFGDNVVSGRRIQNDGRAGRVSGADHDPAHRLHIRRPVGALS